MYGSHSVLPCCTAGSRLDAAAVGGGGSRVFAEAAAPLARGLQGDCEAAAGRVQDACRALLQVVWLTSLPRSTMEELL